MVRCWLPKVCAFCGILINKAREDQITHKHLFIWIDFDTSALLCDLLRGEWQGNANQQKLWLLFWGLEVLDGKAKLVKLRKVVVMNKRCFRGSDTRNLWRRGEMADDWATAVNFWPLKRRYVFKLKTKIKALIVKHRVMVDIKRWNVYINWYCHNNKLYKLATSKLGWILKRSQPPMWFLSSHLIKVVEARNHFQRELHKRVMRQGYKIRLARCNYLDPFQAYFPGRNEEIKSGGLQYTAGVYVAQHTTLVCQGWILICLI